MGISNRGRSLRTNTGRLCEKHSKEYLPTYHIHKKLRLDPYTLQTLHTHYTHHTLPVQISNNTHDIHHIIHDSPLYPPIPLCPTPPKGACRLAKVKRVSFTSTEPEEISVVTLVSCMIMVYEEVYDVCCMLYGVWCLLFGIWL
ncbi:hypothetical protein EON63_25360 [archaeon]|nr:MAG: hypothetical protein EON63_25360 [archaeon]